MLITVVTALVLAGAPAAPARPDMPDSPRDPCAVRHEVLAQLLFTHGFSTAAASHFAVLTAAGCAELPCVITPGK